VPPSEIADSGVIDKVLQDLVQGRSAAITGLSNTGKSTLMKSLAGEETRNRYLKESGRHASLLYVDCNRAVALSAQAFYEVVLRAILEQLERDLPNDLAGSIRGYHQAITEANQSFAASLSFNLALTELCEELGKDLILLIDEFDEIYVELEERALVNMRALRDRFDDRLRYVIATVRDLTHIRGKTVEGEFAEMFSRSTYRMPLLSREDALSFVAGLEAELSEDEAEWSVHLAGGHPGLLVGTAQSLLRLNLDLKDEEAALRQVIQSTQPGAECLKIWTQLTEEEQAHLGNLVLRPEAGLPGPHVERLTELGLLVDGRPFSPIFERFVMRRMRAPKVKDIGIFIDRDSGDVWVDGIRIPVLTDLEFRLMELMDERRDKLTDKYQIVTGVWGEEYLGEVDDARVEKLISRLRSKIEPDPADPRYLITRRGRGYKLLSRPRSS
jgi:DNA-binding winged helix-turn-helix (wHTH) protein